MLEFNVRPRRLGAVAFLLLTCCQTVECKAQSAIAPRAPYAAVVETLERFLSKEVDEKGLPALSIALVDDQEIVWAHGFGFNDRRKKIRRTPRRSTESARCRNCSPTSRR